MTEREPAKAPDGEELRIGVFVCQCGANIAAAVDTGSGTLATACPKCVIHLRCAQADLPSGPRRDLRLLDITELLARSLVPA